MDDDDMPKSIFCGKETRGNVCLTHVLWCPMFDHGRSEQPETGVRRLDIPRDQPGHFELMQHGCRDWKLVTDITFQALDKGWNTDRISDFIRNFSRRRRTKSEDSLMTHPKDTAPANPAQGVVEAKKLLSDMAAMRFGCSGMTLNQVNDWFNEQAIATFVALSNAALAHPAPQQGWRLVPEEPTLEMQNAGWSEAERQGIDINEVELSPIYRAMLASAPKHNGG